MMMLLITEKDIECMKAALRTALPDVKSSHRVEALARGLGWQTNAAMRASLAVSAVEVHADDQTFLLYLREHSFDAPEQCLSFALAKAGIQRVMDLEPDLARFGYGQFFDPKISAEERRAEFAENRKSMLSEHAVEEFMRSIRFLSRFGRRKTINGKTSSYGLKHQAEHFTGGYVANGMFIAAALALGFSAKRTHFGSPNACFNISSKVLPNSEMSEAAA